MTELTTNYFVFIHEPGPNWLPDTPVLEQPLAGHFQYMTELADSGQLVLGGGFLDGAGAMGVLQAATLDEAKQLVAKDSAVQDEIVVARVHPWFVTVAGRIERSSG